ncbi:GNAT family N-acetyltransferase [Rhodocista pekingensis]|uniref:GNAT family N-acetyltransferase n=1 Tax=Rhodocista pekingensis TaxID=201185 RepID=A0ABW2L0N8_9PROT
MAMAPIDPRPLSPGLCALWREVVAAEFGWEQDGAFLTVPALTGGRVLSYLPFLSYTDMTPAAAERLAQEAGPRRHLIRVLDPDAPPPSVGDPVTLRASLVGVDADTLWSHLIPPVCRNRVRRAEKAGIQVQQGRDPEMVRRFTVLLAGTLARHGAPMLPPTLVQTLVRETRAEILLAEAAGHDLAGMVVVPDGDLRWVPWIATDRRAAAEAPGDLLIWHLLCECLGDRVRTVDLGRSPMGGGTFRFKRKWGAVPVPLRLVGAGRLLQTRYMLAQQVWRRLPRRLTDELGPKLVGYLVDY